MTRDNSTEDLLTIGDMYADGKINMWEATMALSSYMSEDEAVDLLKSLHRDNVVKFPEPRSEDQEDEDGESCSKAVFTFTADFELDDPA